MTVPRIIAVVGIGIAIYGDLLELSGRWPKRQWIFALNSFTVVVCGVILL